MLGLRPFTTSLRRPYPLSRILARHTTVPTELFCVKFGNPKISLQVPEDVILNENGTVSPVVGTFFTGPNGCILRPKGPVLEMIIRENQSEDDAGSSGTHAEFSDDDAVEPLRKHLDERVEGAVGTIWCIPEGTPLPPSLVLLQENEYHHSIQCREPMTLKSLNEQITRFLDEHGEKLTTTEWRDRFLSEEK